MKKQAFSISDTLFMDHASEARQRICAKDGCMADGEYKAPRSTQDVRDYIWFCLDHVREYNKSWNYFEGIDEIGMEEAIRQSTTWERPSWKFGTANKAARSTWQSAFDDPLGLFGENEKANDEKESPYSSDDKKALAIFGLSPCTDPQEVKKRYKELAKIHHPDANGGSIEAEERLKNINWAYDILKKTLGKAT